MNSLNLSSCMKLSVAVLAAGMVCQGAAQAQLARPVAAEPTAVEAAPLDGGRAATAIAAAATVKLLNLTPKGATVADGDRACPNQPYYLYSGGKPDNFAAPADLAYPSPNLVQFIPAGGATVAYDTPMSDGRFGDSFNLQNTRGVCYAVIQFKTQVSSGGSQNDGLTMGHLGNGGAPFGIVAQVINPGTATHSYALDAAGRSLLSQQTGWGMNKSPQDSVFDFYLQDDTKLDFFRMFVWYGPHCGGKPSNC